MATRKGGKGDSSGDKGKGGKGGKGGAGGKGKDEKQYPSGSLPPYKSQRISLDDAAALTQRYRKAAPASEHGGFFWAEGIADILRQPGCVGIRYYHGLGEQGNYQIVIVGVDEEGNDIVRVARPQGGKPTTRSIAQSAVAALSTGGVDAVILDQHWPCPPFCPPNSRLN